MTRKRHSGISDAEAVLGHVIRVLETDDSPLDDPDLQLPLLRVYHRALVDLLTFGPLRCTEAIAREREQTDHFTLQPAEVSELRAELLQLLRSTVRGGTSSPISTYKSVTLTARLGENGRAVLAAEGDTRALVILQTVLLLHEVGLSNVRKCAAPDCDRLLVKVYRREFCSTACQKRVNTRKQRQIAREQKARLARRRRQRRKRGA